MLDSNGKRMLAYIVQVDDITSIEGADNIELARVGGWSLIVKKQEFNIGDMAVFFEIDSNGRILHDVRRRGRYRR